MCALVCRGSFFSIAMSVSGYVRPFHQLLFNYSGVLDNFPYYCCIYSAKLLLRIIRWHLEQELLKSPPRSPIRRLRSLYIGESNSHHLETVAHRIAFHSRGRKMAIQCFCLHVVVDQAMPFTILPWHSSTWNALVITLMTVVLLFVLVRSEAYLLLAIPPSR